MRAELRFHPLLFYALAFAIAWAAWTPLLIHVRGMFVLPVPFPVALFVCQTIGAFAPLLSLVVIERVMHEPGLVERVLRKIRFRKVPLRWLLLPPLVPVAIAVVTALVHRLVSTDQPVTVLRQEVVDEVGWALIFVIPFTFAASMIGSPFGEEPGWRGYIFDWFAEHSRSYLGSLLVATLWWIWHVPLFLVLGVAPDGLSFLEMFGHSLLIDSFFLLSGRNLLTAMLYHQGVNIGFMFFNPQTKTVVGLAILLTIALGVRWWAEQRSQRPERPAAS